MGTQVRPINFVIGAIHLADLPSAFRAVASAKPGPPHKSESGQARGRVGLIPLPGNPIEVSEDRGELSCLIERHSRLQNEALIATVARGSGRRHRGRGDS